MPEYKTKDKKSFKEEIITMVVDIFKLGCNEFRGGYTTHKIHGDWTEEVYVPDSRKCFCQAVELLAYILSPHFHEDKKVGEKYKEIMKKIKVIKEKYNNKEIKYEEYIIKKLDLMKDLFKRLMHLLKVLKINEFKIKLTFG